MIIDDCLKLTFADLKRYDLLNKDCIKSTVISWTSACSRSEITVTVDRLISHSVTFSYCVDGEPIKYKIPLVYYPSNLGTGEVGYFRCIATGEKCRTLYFYSDHFVSRKAFNGIYHSQMEPKSYRRFRKLMNALLSA